MLRPRTELHDILCGILGSNHVYYQPPESIKLIYPCIIYERSPDEILYASDDIYYQERKYMLTLIVKDPDSKLPDAVQNLKHCRMDRCFVNDNLHHYTYDIYF